MLNVRQGMGALRTLCHSMSFAVFILIKHWPKLNSLRGLKGGHKDPRT
jgi:hypothetical protein